MDVDHPNYLHSLKTNIVTSSKVGRRRRFIISRQVSNLSNSSLEAAGGEYHAQEPAAVPFVWESSPGTPKRYTVTRSSNCGHEVDYLLPPLTPPPSYLYHSKYASTRLRPAFSSRKEKKQNDANNVNLIHTIFPWLSLKRDHPSTLSSRPSSSSSSSSSSSPSSQSCSTVSSLSPVDTHRLSFEYSSGEAEEEDMVVGRTSSPVSTLCFRRLSCCC